MIVINKIYNMDAIDLLKLIPNNYIDLILTDIPYGEVNRDSNGLRNLDKGDADIFNLDLNFLIEEFCRVCKGSIYVFCGRQQFSKICEVFSKYEFSTRTIIWQKTNPSPMNGEFIWLNNLEICVFGKKKGATFNEFCKGSVIKEQSEFNQKHPTQKPIKLFRYLVEVSSNKGDIVLDPFGGAGTTAVACKQRERNYIVSDLNNEYVKIIKDRLQQNNLNDWVD